MTASTPPPPHPLVADATALSATVRAQLTPAFVRAALAPQLAAYRARKLTIEVVVLSLLELLLRGWPSLAFLVRRLRAGEVTSVPAVEVSVQAFYQRLQALPHTAFLALLQHVVAALAPDVTPRADRRALAPFASMLAVVDDTTLDALARKSDAFVRVARGTSADLAGRLGCVVDLATGLFHAVAYDSDAGSHERHRLLPLVETLPAGALVVLDRGYFAFDLFDALGERFLYFVTRWKDDVTFRVAHTLVDSPHYRDQLVWLGRAGGAEAMAWPVRRVEVRLADGWRAYVTNVWDPRMLPADRLVRLYEARWSIERAFAALKGALGLHTLHPCQLNGLLIQLWCTLLLYQLLETLRAAIARAHAWAPDEVSWALLLEAISLYAERERTDPLPAWLLAGARARDLRVHRPERRKRAAIDRALREDLQTPVTPLDLTTITPQRAKRRASRAKPKAAERYLARIADVIPLAPA